MTPERYTQRGRVFIVDDYPLVREWLATLINQQPDLEVCGQAASAAEAIKCIAAAKPRVAVVDISMEGGSGIQLIKHIKSVCPEVEVLVLSVHPESIYGDRAFRAGARGYITKREATQNVLQALRCVAQGKSYTRQTTDVAPAGEVADIKIPATDSLVIELSDRELEVFQLLGRGLKTRQIAEEMGVNFRTVQAFCTRIKAKLKLSSASELMREATNWHDRQNRK